MYVQLVTYGLEGISEDEYLDVAHGLAPRYAALPGLLAKIWLENPGGNRYGAVYFWEDAESMERFGNSDLFEGDTAEFTDFVFEEFRVLENLTVQTQPVLEIVESRRGTSAGGRSPMQAAVGDVAPEPAVKKAPGKKTAPARALKDTAKTAKTAKKVPVKAPAKNAAVKAPAKKVATQKVPVKKAPAEKVAVKKAPMKKGPMKKAGRKAVR